MFARIAYHFIEFLEQEEGPTAVEYAVLLGLIVVACLVAITSLGSAANETFGNVGLQMAASGS
jgi:pilus assembly protein Flp/PilA